MFEATAVRHELLDRLKSLHQAVLEEGRAQYERWRPHIRRRAFRLGGLNLAHYLAFRRRDLRSLQIELAPWGLSSLGRSEARVVSNLEQVIATLGAVCGEEASELPPRRRARTFYRGERLLARETVRVLGALRPERRVRIMVTLPGDAAERPELARSLVERGMDVARINCAHDHAEAWAAMIDHVKRAAQELGRDCRIFMDLAGPKIRTGQILGENPDYRLLPGDLFLLSREARPDADLGAARLQVVCGLPDAVDQLREGAELWIDDGKIGARVEARLPGGVLVRVTQARPKGDRIRPEKGLNFPHTELRVPALTEKDLRDLDFVARHADAIGYSFVQDAADVVRLQQALVERETDLRRTALVLKIETARAVRNLPDLIVRAAGRQPVGVMIARGDLAIEIGYERLAEIQEELLWLCEAAHVPVIWATQVLERLVKKGTPSRAEITDAAMAERAECVMLNKGPYIAQAVGILHDVLTRMSEHQTKKTPQLRALRSW